MSLRSRRVEGLGRYWEKDLQSGMPRLAKTLGNEHDLEGAKTFALATKPVLVVPSRRLRTLGSGIVVDTLNLSNEPKIGQSLKEDPLKLSWMPIRLGELGDAGLEDVNEALGVYGEAYAAAYLRRHRATREAGNIGFGNVLERIGITPDFLDRFFASARQTKERAGLGNVTSAAEVRRQGIELVQPLVSPLEMEAALRKVALNDVTRLQSLDLMPNQAHVLMLAQMTESGDAALRIIMTTGENPDARILVQQRGHQYQALKFAKQGHIARFLGSVGTPTLFGRTMGGGDIGEGLFFASCVDASEHLARYTDWLVGSVSNETTQLSQLTTTIIENRLAKDSSGYGSRTGLEWIPSAGLVAFGAKNVPLYIPFFIAIQMRAEAERLGLRKPAEVFRYLFANAPAAIV